jgi:mannose-1-phosphate guanylyltransferase / mannose-6-phosphate isomerase
MQAIILAGGRGGRLWPASNLNHPKPFIKVNSEFSLLQETYLRAKNLECITGIITVAGGNFISKISGEYAGVDRVTNKFIKSSFISEPLVKNTAASIIAAAIQIDKLFGPEEKMLILPSDHIIEDKKAFSDSIDIACNFAEESKLVVFGIVPDRLETGFGYIKYSANNVMSFIEKPSLADSFAFIQSKEYLWNSGMFCFKAGCFLKEVEKYSPTLLQSVRDCIALSEISNKNDYVELKLDLESFSLVNERSIDYVLMEKSRNLAVVPSFFGWNDIGNWESFSKCYPADSNGNRINGSAKLSSDAKNCYIENSGKNISVIGVSDIAIINSDEGVLVVNKNRSSEVKNLFAEESKKEDSGFDWGDIKKFCKNDGPNIIQVTINSGFGFRIKDHFGFSANWMVINGFVEFSSSDSVTILSDNETKYISSEVDSYITNVGSAPLIILSIQLDDYMIKNGISRLENSFGQVNNGKVTVL